MLICVFEIDQIFFTLSHLFSLGMLSVNEMYILDLSILTSRDRNLAIYTFANSCCFSNKGHGGLKRVKIGKLFCMTRDGGLGCV